jgi:putative membrane protein
LLAIAHFYSLIKDNLVLEMTLTTLNGLPSFLAYFAVAVALLVAFTFIYSWVTPHHEFELIRANNISAALAFGGALIGFALPLSSAISHSLSLLDCAIWGLVALVVQVLTFLVLRVLVRQLPERITRGEIAVGALSAAVAIAVGQINAACMTY